MYQPIPAAVGIAAARMLHKTLAEFPPVQAGSAPAYHAGARPLGSYLLELGYVTQEQLDNALADQGWAREISVSSRLGDVLVQQGVLPQQVLVTVLILQSIDHLLAPGKPAPRFIGERLLVKQLVTPEQLALGLVAQARLAQRGKRVRLGVLLVKLGIITWQQLGTVLHDHGQAAARDPTQDGHAANLLACAQPKAAELRFALAGTGV